MSVRFEAEKRGRRAEIYAEIYLWLHGYRVIARRFKTPVGEIDLIARKGRDLIFVEVKTRPSLRLATECLTPKGRRRIRRAAQYFLAGPGRAYPGMGARFDLLAMAPPFYIRHLQNAW